MPPAIGLPPLSASEPSLRLPMPSSLFLRKLRPLWLREKLFWRFRRLRLGLAPELFEGANLRFAPGVQLSLKPSDVGHQQIVFLGYVEWKLSKRMQGLASKGGLFVDVGANYGYFTCLWASADTGNRVIAFEASPRNLGMLKRNVERNNLQSRVTMVPKAAGRVPGTMSFSLGPEDETGWGGLSLSAGANEVEVAVTTLDEYIGGLPDSPVIEVLKIDTEGADTWVIYGAEQLLAQKRIKHLFFEENMDRMAKLGIRPGEAQDLLRNQGYIVRSLGSGEWYASV